MIPHELKILGEFQALIEETQYSISQVQVSFLATHTEAGTQLQAAHIQLQTGDAPKLQKEFRTPSILAGRFYIDPDSKSVLKFIENLTDGTFENPHQEIAFPKNTERYSFYFDPTHPEGGQTKVSILSIAGSNTRNLEYDKIS